MALIYDTQDRPARLPCRRKLVGTRHEPGWTAVVRKVRRAVKEAADKASWRADTPDETSLRVIELTGEMHPGALHTLELVAGILVKASRH